MLHDFLLGVCWVLLSVHMSRFVRRPTFCICENKGADQLGGNRTTDQRLCFRYTDSIIPLVPKYEISSHWPSSVTAQPTLCRPRSETPKTGFLRTRLISWTYAFISVAANTLTSLQKYFCSSPLPMNKHSSASCQLLVTGLALSTGFR